MKPSRRKTLVAVAAAAALTIPLHAATVLVDFATVSGSTTMVNGVTWNTVSNTDSANALLDTGGAASGASLIVAFVGGSGVGYGGGAFNNGDPGDTAPAFLLDGGDPIISAIGDGIFANSGTTAYASFSFTGLAMDTLYSFTVYGGRNNTDFSSTGRIASLDGMTEHASYTNRESATFDLLSNGNGEIVFRFDEIGSTGTLDNATLVAMSITRIPEPSAALLGGLGLLALLRRRRG